MLKVMQRSANQGPHQALNQLRALLVTAAGDLRRLPHRRRRRQHRTGRGAFASIGLPRRRGPAAVLAGAVVCRRRKTVRN